MISKQKFLCNSTIIPTFIGFITISIINLISCGEDKLTDVRGGTAQYSLETSVWEEIQALKSRTAPGLAGASEELIEQYRYYFL